MKILLYLLVPLAVLAQSPIPSPFAGGGGGASVTSPSSNGAAFWNGTTLTTTATGGAGTLCLTSLNGAAPLFGSCAGSAATAFSAITGSTNSSAAMVVGSGATLAPTSATAGVISANQINGTSMAGLATGILKNTTTTGVPSIAVANTDYLPVASPTFTGTLTGAAGSFSTTLLVTGHTTFEGVTSTGATGTGNLVYGTSPTFVTPALGTPASGTLTNATGLPISSGVSGLGAGIATFLATPSSANLATAVTNGTGSGALVFATSPTFVTPILGTPTSGTLTNATGLPISTGVSGLGTGVATWLATPSSANLATVVTDETGSGALVFGTSPTLVTPALGTPASGVLTNATGLPLNTGITGTLAFGNGGTGQTAYTDGQLLIGNTATGGLSKATITAGTNVTVTNGNGTITIAASGGGGSGCTTSGSATQILTDSGAGGCTSNPAALYTAGGLTLGTAGSVVGSVAFKNATSGTITVSPPTGALGTVTLTLPATTDTLVGRTTTDTLTNKTLTSPTLTTPALGTPASGVLTNATGLPISTGVSGLGTGIATFLATPSSANLLAAITDETGTGAAVFAGSPTLTGTPVAPTPAASDNSTTLATTAYVTTGIANAIAAVNPAVAVQAASAAVLPNSPTYSNGVSGVGATLTSGSNTALVTDGYTVLLNDRVLVKNQASSFQNGVYTQTTLGTGSVPWVLTRASDFNTPSAMNNSGLIPVDNNGTANAKTGWYMTSIVATIGTDAVTFTQFSVNSANIVTASSPGAGIGHFAGSTQALTSSLIVNADITASTIDLTTKVTGTLPVGNGGTGITSLGTGVATFLGSPTGANFNSMVTSKAIAQNSQSTAYTTVLTDCGGSIYHPGADTTARTWTIDSNANVAAPVGCTITFVNDTSAGVLTIAITSDTMVLAGAGTTGSRTLAASGVATATKMTSTRWMINGTGLT